MVTRKSSGLRIINLLLNYITKVYKIRTYEYRTTGQLCGRREKPQYNYGVAAYLGYYRGGIKINRMVNYGELR